jgi:hypothetical protein
MVNELWYAEIDKNSIYSGSAAILMNQDNAFSSIIRRVDSDHHQSTE